MVKLLTTNKHFLVLICMVAMLCMPQMANATDYECSTWNELMTALDSYYHRTDVVIKLAADIDLNGQEVDGQLLDYYYVASFDGQGHVIKNGKIKGSLISFAYRCTIKNLTFEKYNRNG